MTFSRRSSQGRENASAQDGHKGWKSQAFQQLLVFGTGNRGTAAAPYLNDGRGLHLMHYDPSVIWHSLWSEIARKKSRQLCHQGDENGVVVVHKIVVLSGQ
jgi:hypothetical protein